MMEQSNGKQRVLVNSVADHGTGIGTSMSWQALEKMIRAQPDNRVQDDEVIAWAEVDDAGLHFRVIKKSEATPR